VTRGSVWRLQGRLTACDVKSTSTRGLQSYLAIALIKSMSRVNVFPHAPPLPKVDTERRPCHSPEPFQRPQDAMDLPVAVLYARDRAFLEYLSEEA
jgi:hypothetical protein